MSKIRLTLVWWVYTTRLIVLLIVILIYTSSIILDLTLILGCVDPFPSVSVLTQSLGV